MMRRLCTALAVFFALATSALAAGTVPGFSLVPQFDLTGKVAPGCKLYIIQSGTVSTPQSAYQDSGLTLPLPNPLTCDASGRIGQWFVADGNIKLRLTTAIGTQIFVGDNLLVVGPSSGGGGGGGTVDPTTIASTGDLKAVYGTGVLSGWVRLNGRTIGSATSGATERANSDCQALFQYLWGADANLIVSGGRGASAVADWAANKTITLPDGRGKALASLDDMGNSVAGTYTGVTFFTGTSTTLGALVGTARRTLTSSQLPANIPQTLSWAFTPSFGTNVTVSTSAPASTNIAGGSQAIAAVNNMNTISLGGTIAQSGGQINPSGGSAFDTVSPYILVTTYIKL